MKHRIWINKRKIKLEVELSPTTSPLSVVLESPPSPAHHSKLPLCTSPISANLVQEEDTSMNQKCVIVPSEYFRSPFMVRNIDLLHDLTKAEKAVIDLALLEDDSSSERYIFFLLHFSIIVYTLKTE